MLRFLESLGSLRTLRSLRTLFNIEHQAFQVFAFGMVDVDGVVGWLMKLVQDANLPLSHCSCREDGHSELVFVDGLRTTEGKEYAAWLYHFEGFGVELCIASESILEGILVLGKSGRVENDEVVRALTLDL